MKEAMAVHIRGSGLTMFENACNRVETCLGEMVADLEYQIEQLLDSILDRIKDEYTNLIVGIDILKALAKTRDRLRNLLLTADSRFDISLRIHARRKDLSNLNQEIYVDGDACKDDNATADA
jgi:hypothetical protein